MAASYYYVYCLAHPLDALTNATQGVLTLLMGPVNGHPLIAHSSTLESLAQSPPRSVNRTALLAWRFSAPAKPVLVTRLPPKVRWSRFFGLLYPFSIVSSYLHSRFFFAAGFFADFVDGRLWAVTPVSLTARLRGDFPPRTGRTSETIVSWPYSLI
jgi:hypothetical protein